MREKKARVVNRTSHFAEHEGKLREMARNVNEKMGNSSVRAKGTCVERRGDTYTT
jgi:hypothetical protein